jgi:signal peptide peptidase SppA
MEPEMAKLSQGFDIGPDTVTTTSTTPLEAWTDTFIGETRQPTDFKYPRILRYVASTPWAMEPTRLLDMLDVLSFKAHGGQLSPAEIREYCGVKHGDSGIGQIMAGNLSDLLNRLIDERAGDDEDARQRLIGRMASEAGISESTVGQILRGEIACPPLRRLAGFARALNVPVSRLRRAAESDGCEYNGGDDATACPTPLFAARGNGAGSGAVAILPLRGMISNHMSLVSDVSGPGGASIEGFRKNFRAALAMDEVGAIVLDIDSPGGSVEGVQELADEILSARGAKPIVAVANTMAASAAFWIASAADELIVAPSGQVGSIGVFSAHEDISKRLEAEGTTVTLVHAGKFKVEGNPFEPLTDEAREFMQDRVNAVHDTFVDAVAKGRNATSGQVKREMGQGRLVSARAALTSGMVDRVETLEQTVNRFRGTQSKSSIRAQSELRRYGMAFK